MFIWVFLLIFEWMFRLLLDWVIRFWIIDRLRLVFLFMFLVEKNGFM